MIVAPANAFTRLSCCASGLTTISSVSLMLVDDEPELAVVGLQHDDVERRRALAERRASSSRSCRPRSTSGSSRPRRRCTGAPWIDLDAVAVWSPSRRTSSSEVDLRDGVAVARRPATIERRDDRQGQRDLDPDRGALAEHAERASTVPPIRSMFVLTTSMPDAAAGDVGDRVGGGEAGRKISSHGLAVAHAGALRRAVTSPRSTALARDLGGVDAGAVVGDLDVDLAALVEGAQRAACPRRACRRRRGPSGVSMPWSTALRTRWVSGSLIASRIVLSSSVSLPSISRPHRLPQRDGRGRARPGGTCSRRCRSAACGSS